MLAFLVVLFFKFLEEFHFMSTPDDLALVGVWASAFHVLVIEYSKGKFRMIAASGYLVSG